jgi:hypothetical protein
MQSIVAQELHVYDEQMLASRLFYFSSYVKEVWKHKGDAIEKGVVYIGGVHG